MGGTLLLSQQMHIAINKTFNLMSDLSEPPGFSSYVTKPVVRGPAWAFKSRYRVSPVKSDVKFEIDTKIPGYTSASSGSNWYFCNEVGTPIFLCGTGSMGSSLAQSGSDPRPQTQPTSMPSHQGNLLEPYDPKFDVEPAYAGGLPAIPRYVPKLG